ncbi:hypothetical protein [Flavobacterium fluviatile]|uniref:hypothetical protein n=1 Tax=Flavobacterium fluviatile TaxID=1862387 RepID=UPI0013D5A0E3|nr:hypothetical protein [Flavobacterium fluviatile]
MTTQNKENYGRDVRSFHHPEDDMKPASDITNHDLANQIYTNEYDDDEEIVNDDDDIVNNEDDDELNNQFANASERDIGYPAENYLDEDNENSFVADQWDEEIDPNDIDDDLEEDYDENDREIDNFANDTTKKDLLDLEYDIDQDLEETDPVNHPRNFKY